MFLRIQATYAALTQMLYSPTSSTAPGYTFIFNFQTAVLADTNDVSLFKGFVSTQVNPSAVQAFHLTMLGRLLQPFTGYFEMDVQGSYTISNGIAQVLVDSISACDIQPA